MIERVRTVLGLLGRAGAVVMTVAAPWSLAFLRVYGPGGWLRVVLSVVVVMGLAAFSAVIGWLFVRVLRGAALVLAAGFSFLLTPPVATKKALAERDRVSTCGVEEERAHGVMDQIPAPDSPDFISDVYGYRLRGARKCEARPPCRSGMAEPATPLRVATNNTR